jgi:CRP-like cAMP-binding protein
MSEPIGIKRLEPVHNRILLALPPQLREEIRLSCEPVDLPARHLVYASGEPIEYVYFINSGIVGLTKPMEDGDCAAVGATGIEGMVGAFAARGFDTAIVDYVVLAPATAWRIKCTTLRHQLLHHKSLSRLIEAYLFLLIQQLVQFAACNRLHSLEQRYCNLLLRVHDNAFADRFILVQEFFALLLGAQRPSVAVVANPLKQRGLIDYSRGQISVLDRASLEQAACECYRANSNRIDGVFRSAAEPRSD